MQRLFLLPLFFTLLLVGLVSPSSAQTPQPSSEKLEESITLQYPNIPATDILPLYEKLTGKTLVRDANLAGPNLNISSSQPMPKSQAIRMIEAALLLNGYSIIPDSDKRAKIININGGKNPRSEGTPLYANASSLPVGDQVVSYFMPLRFISSQDAFTIFQGQFAPHTYGSIVQVPNADALVITENVPTIKQLIGLQELIDVPPARVVSEFVTLQRADAERVADLITKLVESKNGSKTKTGGAAAPNPATNPGGVPIPGVISSAKADLYENDIIPGSVQLVADTRTNRILVITRPANFSYIKGLIEEFDKAVGSGAPLIRPLKYISASEVLPVLGDLLKENETGKEAQQTPGTQQQNTQQRYSRQNQSTGSTGLDNNNNSGTGTGTRADVLTAPEDMGPTSIVVGKVRLIADNKANAILVFGSPESQDKVRTILDSLDKRPAQVYLSTVIGQLKLGNGLDVGVDYLKLFQSGGSTTTSTTNGSTTTTSTTSTHASGIAGSVVNNAVTSLLDPRNLTAASVFPATSGLVLYGTIGKSLSVYVHALESTNRFKVLARPVVYTANNKKAVISSGQRIAVPTSTISTYNNTISGNGSLNSNIEYRDVVLKLEVIPLINSKNEVNLQIAQVDDRVSGSQTISGNTVPTISTETITTTVTVPNGATVALGGLITESTTKNLSGIPLLMNIPYIGAAFRTTSLQKERDELIILIQPTVVLNNNEMMKSSGKEIDRFRVGNDAYDFSENPQPGLIPDTADPQRK